jgi:hypothetical protein
LGAKQGEKAIAESRCFEANKATDVAASRRETLCELGALGEARISRHQRANELKRDVVVAADLAAGAKAAHDRVQELESADRAQQRRARERRDEIETEGFFRCKR